MPKTLTDYCIAVLISGVLLIGLLRTHLLPSRYCTTCGNRLKRKSCCYASKPAEEVWCANPTCHVHYVATAYKTIDLDNS